MEIAVRVAQASEAFTGHASDVIRWDIDSAMFDPKFLNTSKGPGTTSKSWQALGGKGQSKMMGMNVTH